MSFGPRLTRLCLPLIVIFGVTFAFAETPPTSLFQLDGQANGPNWNTCSYSTGTNPQACDYWNLLNGTGVTNPGTGSSPGHSSARSFIDGTTSTLSFTGGGSKDPNPISQWSYSSSPTPNKDTLNHGYAAAYTAPVTNDLVVVFGADRQSVNGDANIGIWFFQQTVLPDGNGGFTGAHTDHDIFVVSAFTGGGTTPNIAVYEWDHTCNKAANNNPQPGQCAAANLRLLANVAAQCSQNSTSLYCAITNGSTITTNWTSGSVLAQAFFTGGVNITAALAEVGVTALPCFTSFLEETRSSQSPSAVLKDFIAGSFPVCGLNVTKACGTASAAGNTINYPVSGVVTNIGAGALYNAAVSDVVTYADGRTPNPVTLNLTVTNNVSGSTYFGTSTLGPGETGTWGTTLSSTASSVQDQATASASTASSGGTTVTSSPTNLITCSLSVSSTLKVGKSCNPGTTLVASGGDVHVNVGYSGKVCNNGPSNITGLALTDYHGASNTTDTPTLTSTSLSACNSADGLDANGFCNTATACTTYTGSYNPTSIDATGTFGRYFFNDEVAITGATAAIGSLTTTTCNGNGENRTNAFGCSGQVSCPICDKGECVQ